MLGRSSCRSVPIRGLFGPVCDRCVTPFESRSACRAVVGVSASEGVLGARVRALADVLAALFEHDRRLAGEMNAAQRRLLGAAEQVRAVTAGSAGRELADTVRRAFVDYQQTAEERRIVSVDAGEAVARLVDELTAAGFTDHQARNADVWALRDGVYRAG